jgi:hypothetical protein
MAHLRREQSNALAVLFDRYQGLEVPVAGMQTPNRFEIYRCAKPFQSELEKLFFAYLQQSCSAIPSTEAMWT